MSSEKYLERALAAADWFVNTQVLMTKPHWDANHGRLVYTYHLPTRNRVLGLSWTQGRGIITLLAAWEASGRGEYLRAAVQAADYVKHLQILDLRLGLCQPLPADRCQLPIRDQNASESRAEGRQETSQLAQGR